MPSDRSDIPPRVLAQFATIGRYQLIGRREIMIHPGVFARACPSPFRPPRFMVASCPTPVAIERRLGSPRRREGLSMAKMPE